MKNPESEVRSLLEAFARDVQTAVRESLVAELQSMLGGAPAKRGPGRPKGTKAGKRGPGRPPKAAAAKTTGRRGRPAKVDAGLNDKVLAAIKADPGRSVSDIAAGMRMKVEAVKKPIAQLLAAKQISKRGKRRGTKYYAA
jgi:hypothetical protein